MDIKKDAKIEIDKDIRNTSQASVYGSEDQQGYLNGDVVGTQISSGVWAYRQLIVRIGVTFVASLFTVTLYQMLGLNVRRTNNTICYMSMEHV